jgi:aryl-phospho-beta-D-glucosidase BglC (GH1 family)
MHDDIFLQAKGANIVTRSGKNVLLKGVGLGGWMNMENFITGFPATESLQRRAILAVLGTEGYNRFFNRFLDVFFGEDDAAFLASLGMNCVRLPVNYRHFESDMKPFELIDDGFKILDRAIDRCANHKIYTVIDLHALPGYQNQHWHSDNPTHRAIFWDQKHFQDRVVHLWEALAGRYRDNPWVAGYNPINEPADPTGTVIYPFYQRLHNAIRSIDASHLLFLDGNRYSTEFDIFKEVWPNTIYTCHDYALPGFYEGGDYPGTSRGIFVDKNYLEKTFLERTEYMRQTNTPIWVGEFGPVYLGNSEKDNMRYNILIDQLNIFRKHNASWSIWTYKDIGLQGLVYVDPNSPYLQRLKALIAKKARLGVDAWGSAAKEMRLVIEPIEEAFRKEFPDYQPFPFGQQDFINTLTRNILFAEPLVEDFKKCFEGVSPSEAEDLASSFRHDACLKRHRLLDILRKDAIG